MLRSMCSDCRAHFEGRVISSGRRVRYSPNRETPNIMSDHPSKSLANFAATLRFEDIPAPVLRRAEDLFLDWFGSALAGKGARPVEAIERFAAAMGPAAGESEVLISRRRTSPIFAAMINAASSHFAEQDDVHNGAVFHPGAVVLPPALAVAQAIGSSGPELLTAAVAGYEVGIRVGEFLGRSHYQIFHTTGTAGTLAAAAAVGRLLDLSAEQMLDAFGSAGTQSAGLWNFCAMQPTRNNCTPPKPRQMVCFRHTSRRKGLLAPSIFWRARREWQPACQGTLIPQN